MHAAPDVEFHLLAAPDCCLGGASKQAVVDSGFQSWVCPSPKLKNILQIIEQKIKGELELLPLNLVKKDIKSRSVCASRRLQWCASMLATSVPSYPLVSSGV
jgi:hypothetical protein